MQDTVVPMLKCDVLLVTMQVNIPALIVSW